MTIDEACPACGVHHRRGPRACVSSDPGTSHEAIGETRAEIERLRGIIEGARFFIGEDMLSCAAIILHGMGIEGGTDPTLADTEIGAALIREHCDERDVIEAARALVATMTTDTLPDGGTRWQEARVLREALAKLGDPR